MFPNAAKGKERMIGPVDEPGLLALGADILPLIKAIGQNQAAAPANGIFEAGLFIDGFAARIDQRPAGLNLLGPAWHETPAHQREVTLAIRPVAHDGNGAAGVNVLAR